MSIDKSSVNIDVVEPDYVALVFAARHGHALAIVVGLALFAAGCWATVAGLGALGLVAGAAVGALAYLLLRILWDVARLLCDTMIPK